MNLKLSDFLFEKEKPLLIGRLFLIYDKMAQILNRIAFQLREGEDFIPLIALLKAAGMVESGSEAQDVVVAGMVLRNGEVETRKRAKITPGEVIVFQNYEIEVEECE